MNHRIIYYLPILISGLVGASLLLIMGHTPCDDAYITFRHARNFSDHFIFSWNITGKYDFGSTTPFFAFLLGIFGFIFSSQNIPLISLYVNAFLILLNAFLFFYIVLEITENYAISVAITFLLSVNSYSIRIYSQGFESCLFITFFFLGLLLLQREKYKSIMIITSLIPFVRPEGIILSIIVLPYLLFRRKLNFKLILIYSAIPFLWILFSLFLYSSIVPQSIVAKYYLQKYDPMYEIYGKNTNLIDNLKLTFDYIKEIWNIILKPVILYNAEPGVKFLYIINDRLGNFFLRSGNELLLTIIFMLFFVPIYLYRKRKFFSTVYYTYVPFFIIFLGYSKALSPWYIPIWIISCLLLLNTGFYLLATLLIKYIKKPGVYILSFTVILLFLGKNLYFYNDYKYEWQKGFGKFYAPAHWDKIEYNRFNAYKNAAIYLNKQSQGTVAMHEVGFFGFYYTNGNVIDLSGLCSSRVVKIYREKNKKDNLAVINELNPSYLIGFRKNDKELESLNYEIIYTDEKFKIFWNESIIYKKK
ncbi:MAG: hypothetical protein H7A23_08215 [Leptospiraceae bacterium]|nr:hypothetical protein [Leptospiraceae bacterium]